jgi:hypothetical protein
MAVAAVAYTVLWNVTEPLPVCESEVHETGPVVWVPVVYPPPNAPVAPVTEVTANVRPVPVFDSLSVIVALEFVVTPDDVTVALAVAVVVPGIGMPVTVST